MWAWHSRVVLALMVGGRRHLGAWCEALKCLAANVPCLEPGCAKGGCLAVRAHHSVVVLEWWGGSLAAQLVRGARHRSMTHFGARLC